MVAPGLWPAATPPSASPFIRGDGDLGVCSIGKMVGGGVPDVGRHPLRLLREMSQAAPLLAVGGNATNKTQSRSDTAYGQVEAKRAMSA